MLWLPSFTGLDSIHSKLSLFVLSSYVVLGARTSHLTVATPPLNHSSQTETMAMHHASSYPSDETSACSLPPTRPRRATRRREDVSSTIIAACILSIIAFPDVALGFAPVCNVALRRNENIYQPPTFPTEQRQRSHSNIFQQGQRDGAFKTSQHMSSIAVARMGSPGKRRSSFKDRMRNIVVKDKLRSAEAKVGGKNGRPSNVKVVHTLEDYKTAVGDENEKLVVVRFYATWCKACRAMAPYFYKLAQTYKDIQFVEVPVTDKNANLHQGLGVPSLPYGHIYHPSGGLVEELKINRKHFSKFAKVVHSYAQTTCDLIDGETTNPYPDPEEEFAESSRSTAEVSA